MPALEAASPPARRHLPRDVNVKELRKNLGMSQTAFARRFGFSLWTLQEWEQDRRRPGGAARVLLMVIARHPDLVAAIISGAAKI